MRQLRYAGPGEDATQVLLEAVDGTDRYTLVLDDALRTAARQELPRLDRLDDDPPSLSPRDIQTRVRAGASPESIAGEASLPVDKVMRFAYPVLQERARVTDEARRSRARLATPNGEMAPFGETVDARLAVHGVESGEVSWDSFRRPDGQWTVTAGWRETDSDRFAQWTFGLSTRVIAPLDDTAAALLSDRPLLPLGLAVDDDSPSEPEDETTVGGAFDADGMAGGFHEVTLHSANGGGTVGAGTDTAVPTGPIPWVGSATDGGDPAPRGLDSFFSPRTPDSPLTLDDEPPLPLTFDGDANAPTGRRFRHARRDELNGDAADLGDAADQKAARARIPSWDDILLGVRRRTD